MPAPSGGESFESPGERPGNLLWRAALAWQRAVAEALEPFGLTHARFVLLAVLSWWGTTRDERPSQRALGQACGMDAMMASQVARALERRELLVRTPDPRDARTLRLSLTPYGRRHAARAIRAVEAADEIFFASIENQATFVAALRALARLEPEG